MKASIVAAVVLALSFIACGGGALADPENEQKAVLVTGASSGIGLKIAEVLAANGYYIYAGARKAADLERLDAMDNVSSVRLDVTVQDEIDAAVEFVNKAGRGLWGIVNNAGIAVYSPLSSGPESDVQFTFDVNVFGPFRVNQAFLSLLVESGGRTTTIGSISGYIAHPGSSYSMSKFAIEAYTDSLAEELSGSGVHVSVVEPGAYKSKFRDQMAGRALASAKSNEMELDEETREFLAGFVASNATMKEPDEVAEAVLHLLSSDHPKRRYMVTPNKEQADRTIRVALGRLLELNADQPYTLSRDELIALLDELLEAK